MTLTIRQRWLNVQTRHYPCNDGTACSLCGHAWPCPDTRDAVAAIQALDEATRYEGVVFYPWGAPPSEPMRARLVPDPDPAPPTEDT